MNLYITKEGRMRERKTKTTVYLQKWEEKYDFDQNKMNEKKHEFLFFFFWKRRMSSALSYHMTEITAN